MDEINSQKATTHTLFNIIVPERILNKQKSRCDTNNKRPIQDCMRKSHKTII